MGKVSSKLKKMVGGSSILLKIRRDLLHTTDSGEVIKEIHKIMEVEPALMSKLEEGDGEVLNILKYVARLHGLPVSLKQVLCRILLDKVSKNVSDAPPDPSIPYKASLALKYAVGHNEHFIPLQELLNILFKKFPLTEIRHHGDFFKEEIITQLMLTIVKLLNPDRIAMEEVNARDIWNLENYLGHSNGKYRSEVRRSLEKAGYCSGRMTNRGRGAVGPRGGAIGHHDINGSGGNGLFFQSGEEIIASSQQRRGINVSAHVVKTQQTEAVTTEENISEKTQMSNISLRNSLEQSRAKTAQAARAREKLPPTKSTEGSDRWWFKSTGWEVSNFLQKAKGDGAISKEDVQYLRHKFDGFKFSIVYDDHWMVKMIAETFCLISKYQILETEMIEGLLKVVLDPKFGNLEARNFILKTTDRHCNRLGQVPQGIRNKLKDFHSNAPERIPETSVNLPDDQLRSWGNSFLGQILTGASELLEHIRRERRKYLNELNTNAKELISEILFSDPNSIEDTLRLSIGVLEKAKTTGQGVDELVSNVTRALNFIQRHLWISSSKSELEKEVQNMVHALFTALRSLDRPGLQENVLEVIEAFLHQSWTRAFKPSDLDTLLSLGTCEDLTEDTKRKCLRCVLRSMEKGLEEEGYFQQFSNGQLCKQFGILFDLLTYSSTANGSLKIFTIVMLSTVLNNSDVKPMVSSLVSPVHVDSLRKQLARNDVLLRSGEGQPWKVVMEEELTPKFFEKGPSASQDGKEEFELVSAFVGKLLLTLAEVNPALVGDDVTISTVCQVLQSSKGKMTRILCSELMYELVANSTSLYFSLPILNRIQDEVFSLIPDIHVYITCAYCISLSNQAKSGSLRLKAQHVNFLINLYAHKNVTLGNKDYSACINPNIMEVFQVACETGVEISEHVFHLLALVLNGSCADSEEAPDYPVVKSILNMLMTFCKRDNFQATDLPSGIVEAVENLLLESDVFDETCAGITELCMVAGRWLSDSVLEEFAKYLLHEPQVSIPFLRRLAIANENQELPDPIFVSFQMELIGQRLLSAMGMLPQQEDLRIELAGMDGGDAVQLFNCLAQYVNSGMRLSKLNLEVVTMLLEQWKGSKCHHQREAVLCCLTSAASNGQSLPRQVIKSSLRMGEGIDFGLQLKFADAVVMRGQPLPEELLNRLFDKLNKEKDFTQGENGKDVLGLTNTMILHNQELPPNVIQAYCSSVAKHKVSIITSDVLSAIVRLLENRMVTEKKSLSQIQNIFLYALDSPNLSLNQLGGKGLNLFPESSLDHSTKEKMSQKGFTTMSKEQLTSTVSLSTTPSKKELVQAVKNSMTEKGSFWKLKWTPAWRERLAHLIRSHGSFPTELGKMMLHGQGDISEFEEEVILHALCLAVLSLQGEGMKEREEICLEVIADVLKTRKSKSDTVQHYLGNLLERLNEKEVDRETLDAKIIVRDGPIPLLVLTDYHAALMKSGGTTSWEACANSLASYLRDNANNLGWQEKWTILSIFNFLARRHTPLPQSVLDAVAEGVFNPEDSFLRGLCFSVLLTLREKNTSQWRKLSEEDMWGASFQSNLNTLYEHLSCSPDETESVNDDVTLHLAHVLHTLKFVDLGGLKGKRMSDWATHLMTSDTILQLSSSVDEQLQLYPVAKGLCSRGLFQSNPNFRLFLLNGIKDYVAEHHGTMSTSRLLQLVDIALESDGNSEMERKISSIPKWIEGMISSGYAVLIKDKLRGSSPKILELVIQQFLFPQAEIGIPLTIFDKVVTLIEIGSLLEKSPPTISTYELKALMEFIGENSVQHPIFNSHLTQLVQLGKGVTIMDVLASLQTQLLLAIIPSLVEASASHTEYYEQVAEHLNSLLLLQRYDYDLVKSLLQKVGAAVEKKSILPKQGHTVLENILWQLISYRVRADNFPHIFYKLSEKKISEWIEACNDIVMEGLFTVSQGEKTALTIGKEFREMNHLTMDFPMLADDEFRALVKRVQTGKFQSKLKSLDLDHLICVWMTEDIRNWARTVKGRKLEWSREFLEESLAVISRACFLHCNYNLTPIQVLSVMWLTDAMEVGGGKGGTLLQVATGSGKSTIIVALAVIRGLMKSPVDIYTSSPVLAERDAKSWAPFYEIFGLICDHNGDKGTGYVKGEKNCYKKDIVYGDTAQFQFDALRHEYSGLGTRGKRQYGYSIVDEVDSMFVDDSSKLARLSSTLPGMDLLQVVYHLVWHRLHDIQHRLYAVAGNTYYLEGARRKDNNGNVYYIYAEPTGKEVTISNIPSFILRNQNRVEELEKVFIFKVKDIDTFVVEHLKKYTEALIGDHEFRDNNTAVQKLSLPKHLRTYARSQVTNWVDSAITAIAFQENIHYVIDKEQIKPVDYQSTGIVQASTNWNNGLHQFLQIKHSLKVTSETLTTNFLSNMAIFQKYGGELVGFSGTLGSSFGQKTLKDVYSVETYIVPELYYKRFQLLGEHVLPGSDGWTNRIAHSALHESSKGRAVLVICKTIIVAELIAEHLERKNVDGRASVKLYTRNDFAQERHVQQANKGDVIVATNLAGRGTDINTTNVEGFGGLHVILTFLPDSLRVEEQAFGRTARQGKKGTGELILMSREKKTIEELRRTRDDNETTHLKRFREKELIRIQAKDKVFSMFCKIYSQIREEYKSSMKENLGLGALQLQDLVRLQSIEQQWAIFLKKLDDNETKLAELDKNYCTFASRIEASYKNLDESITSTENGFFWLQLGNEEYRKWNVKSDHTDQARKFFQKGIDIDADVAAAGHAGLGFCLLKGKTHIVGKNSHKDGYKAKAIQHFTDALKILNTEIGTYSTVQGLLKLRGGEVTSELFNQLTEKMNLVGQYAKNIEGTISTLEKSLRKVYLTQVDDEKQLEEKRCLGEEQAGKGEFSSSSKLHHCEFRDLTYYEDSGRKDQAINTVGELDNVTLTVENQNLEMFVQAVGINLTFSVHLFNINSPKSVTQILEAMGIDRGKGFTLGVASIGNEFLVQVGKVLPGRKARVTWYNKDGSVEYIQGVKLQDGDMTSHTSIPNDHDLSVEIDLQLNDDLEKLDSLLAGVESKLFLVLKDVTGFSIKKGWTAKSEAEERMVTPGLLQAFPSNRLTSQRLSNKRAKTVISALRDKNIDFRLILEELSYEDTVTALCGADRTQENIDQKALKEMGSQYSSSTYIPLEIIRELVQRGIALMPEFGERAFIPWRSVIAVSMLACVQVAAGGILICTGFGASVGMGLLTEGMADFTMSYRVYSTRQFSWQDYAIQKAVSLTISAVSMGLTSLKDGTKGVSTIVQGAATEVAEQAGTKVVTMGAKQTLNQGIKSAGQNLRSLALKQIGVQGTETAARVAMNAIVESVVEFSLDQVKEHLSQEVEVTVSREFRAPKFVGMVGSYSTVYSGDALISKVTSWMNEVTNPQSGNWNKAWDSVAYPLCQGILSDPQYLGSKFSMALRVAGILNGCREIVTITASVCEHIRDKLDLEHNTLTPSYVIQERFGTSPKEADEIVLGMEFGKDSPFHVKSFPRECKVDKVKLKKLFEDIQKGIKGFKTDCELISRCIKTVTGQVTTHITHATNRQLVSPVTTFAVGKLVASISQHIQSQYLVSDSQLSADQLKVCQLKEKDPNDLSKDDRDFLQRNDRPVTFAEQIRGNAKDYTVAYQKRDIIAVISTINEEDRKGKEIPDEFSKEAMSALQNILGGGPADMTVVFLLAQLNNQEVKLVDDIAYEPTEEDKKSGVKIIVWEKPAEGQTVGHYKLKDAANGTVTDFVGGNSDDCAYNVLSSITGKPPADLRLQGAVFVACNQDKFGRIVEGADWIKERHPQEANALLHKGGRAIPTTSKLETASRRMVPFVKKKNELEGEDETALLLVDYEGFPTSATGEGSTPNKNANVTRDAKALSDVLKSDPNDKTYKIERKNEDGSITVVEKSVGELKEMYGKRFVAGHMGQADLGIKGTDMNMVPICNSLNQKMYHNFEKKCREFIIQAKDGGFPDKMVSFRFLTGNFDKIEVHGQWLPLVDNVTCEAGLNLPDNMDEAMRSKVTATFHKAFFDENKPPERNLKPIRNEINEVTCYRGTFTNQLGSQMTGWEEPYQHENTIEVESSEVAEG